ncbi:MAG TPA: nodulation protein NfeD [Candidatus Glassbacteria bacterium]|nr:nodulation protein NfeD [Candidatus Glassbacteria bacterium]
MFKKIAFTLRVFLVAVCLPVFFRPAAEVRAARVDVAVVNGMIGPVSEQFIESCLEAAGREGADLVVIQLDTPGGLLSTTRELVKTLLASRVPVAVYVAPSGSRAGSAGVFITMAAHVAAMAPGTNIGAAHPVSVGFGGGGDDSTSAMSDKILNDTAAFIKTITSQRDRNVAWADSAVRFSVSITETEALERGVIDLVAPSVEALVDSLDGRAIAISSTDTVTLDLDRARIVTHEYNWRYKLLDRLGDPNIAYILFLAGLAGLYFELSNPGLIFPGVVGGISLILAFFAFQTLPINYAGVALIVFAILLFILEIKVPSFGLLTTGAIISLVLGSIMLYKGDISPTMPEVRVSWEVLIPTVVFITLFFLVVVGKTIKSQRSKTVTGSQGIVGEIGRATTRLAPEGKVFVHGEIWNARAAGDPIKANAAVQVVSVSGLSLVVEPADKN